MSLYQRLSRGLGAASLMLLLFTLPGCGGGGGGGQPRPDEGTLSVTVTNATPAAITGVRVAVFDAATDSLLRVLVTDATGNVSTTLPVGSVRVKVSAQGYESVPASTKLEPLPFVIAKDQTTSVSYALDTLSDAASRGWISGRVLNDLGAGMADTLVVGSVVINTQTQYFTTSSDTQGNFVLHNVPAPSATVTAFRAGYNFNAPTVTVNALAETQVDIAAASVATGIVSGQVTFRAAQNGVVDVTLLHPETGQVIPGLVTMTSSNIYNMSGVPNGTFDAIASRETDGYVLDPDYVVKSGVPTVVMTGGAVDLPFSVTDTFQLRRPVNNETLPAGDLRFEWYSYPQAKFYLVEVIDEWGDTIWGGNVWDGSKAFTVDAGATAGRDAAGAYYSVKFDVDGTAKTALEVGHTYRVRIYATDGPNSGYKLLSMTEDLEGVFTVTP